MKRNYFIRSMGLLGGSLLTGQAAHTFGSPGGFSRGIAGLTDEQELWKRIREQFLFPDDFIYLNTGGIGGTPLPVLEMMEKSTRDAQASPRPGHDVNHWEVIKGKLAPFIGPTVQAEEIALVGTATEGLNIILNGLKLRRGDEVITTTHEHVALNVPLLNHARHTGIRIRHFRPDQLNATEVVESINQLITKKTRLIILSHVTCTTGQLLPVDRIGELARSRGVLLCIDGAQATGWLPMDVKASAIDFYATCGHKWLLGPKRTGFLYVERSKQELVRPTCVGAYSDAKHDLEEGLLELWSSARRYEYGTQNEPGFFGLETAAEFIQAIGLEKVYRHDRELAERFYHGLLEIPSVEILSPKEMESRSSMITFRIRNKDYKDTANQLSGPKKIRVRQVPEAGVNGVRASFHLYNQESDVDRILEEIGKMS
ncbi:MAG: aminotransferase class V-fold PLP-dependent enzyme [Bacteroidales bacterium]